LVRATLMKVIRKFSAVVSAVFGILFLLLSFKAISVTAFETAGASAQAANQPGNCAIKNGAAQNGH
jgi:hypothetical protein